jgi:hypothetical protein
VEQPDQERARTIREAEEETEGEETEDEMSKLSGWHDGLRHDYFLFRGGKIAAQVWMIAPGKWGWSTESGKSGRAGSKEDAQAAAEEAA